MTKDLIGTWRVVYSEVNGEMTPVAHYSGISVTFKDKTFEIEVHGVLEHEGTYSINEKVTPHEITYVYRKSSRFETGKPRVGIMQMNGNTLKDVLGTIGAAAPKAFETGSRSNSVMTIYQRSGAEKGRGISTFNVSPQAILSQW